MKLPEATVTAGNDWRSLGACLAEDPELFFPLSSSGPGGAQIATAKAVCAHCQVRNECLGFAMSTGQEHGVWGGTSEEERKALRRAQHARSPRRGVQHGGRRRRERRTQRVR
jgi:WhiB family transcriptional regulator, redox-sensing transcriptional regulator